MAKKLDEFIGSLPKEKQIATEQGFQKLDAEYIAFQELRKAMHFTQEQVVQELDMDQRNLSKLEKRTDLRPLRDMRKLPIY